MDRKCFYLKNNHVTSVLDSQRACDVLNIKEITAIK